MISVASLPTVTMPRIKALITGTLPSFMDYFINLKLINPKESESKSSANIIEQIKNLGKKVVFFGDDTWLQIVSKEVFDHYNETSSLFATDYTEVDTNVTYNVDRELKNLNDWDAMIVHYLGVDHIGHLRGFRSKLMPTKLAEMDGVFKNIFETIALKAEQNDSYLFVVTGDHGMTDTGNHGGNTPGETDTALMFLTNDKSKLEMNQNERIDKILQIDIASTIAALLKLDLLPNNQGRLISSVLERFSLPKDQHLCLLLRNSQQIRAILVDDKIESNAILLDAIDSHLNFVKNTTVEEFYNESKSFYQNFIKVKQQKFLHRTLDRSLLSKFPLLILISFGIVIAIIKIEINQNFAASILMTNLKTIPNFFSNYLLLFSFWFAQNSPKIDLNQLERFHRSHLVHLEYQCSPLATILIIAIVSIKFFALGSVNFMLKEHIFWYSVSLILLSSMLLMAIR